MPDPNKTTKHVLEPHERIAEILFGLIMVVTVTGSLHVAHADSRSVRTMLIGAIGCNVAWGIVDGVFYLVGCLAERRRHRVVLREVRKTDDPQKAHRLIGGALPPLIASLLQPSELEALRLRLKQLPEPSNRVLMRPRDLLGALAVFSLVVVSTFPVALPFIFMQDARQAVKISHAIAILMLFALGVVYGRCIGRPPWIIGIVMVAIGAVLIALTMALGG